MHFILTIRHNELSKVYDFSRLFYLFDLRKVISFFCLQFYSLGHPWTYHMSLQSFLSNISHISHWFSGIKWSVKLPKYQCKCTCVCSLKCFLTKCPGRRKLSQGVQAACEESVKGVSELPSLFYKLVDSTGNFQHNTQQYDHILTTCLNYE